jgi:hypothetical protein
MARRISIVAAVVTLAAAITASTASAQATSYSGHARPLSISAFGVGVSIGDPGKLPSSGGSKSAGLVDLNVLGFASVGVLKGSVSGSGDTSTTQASLASVSLPIIGLEADVIKSEATAQCNGATPALSGSAELVNVSVLGMPIGLPMPNLSVTLPGGISVILNEQTSSTSGGQGTMTVNAIHVTGPGTDIVLSSAEAGITCA